MENARLHVGLLLTLVFLLVGCGGGKSGDEDTSDAGDEDAVGDVTVEDCCSHACIAGFCGAS